MTPASPIPQLPHTEAKEDLHSASLSSRKSTTEQSTSPLKAVRLLANEKSQLDADLIPESSPKSPTHPVGTTSQNYQFNSLPSFPSSTISSATPVQSDNTHYVYLQQQQMFMNMMIQQMEMLKNQVMLQTNKDSLQSQSSSVSSRSCSVSVSTGVTETPQNSTVQTNKNLIMKEIGTNTTFVDSSTWLSKSKMVTSIGTNTTFTEANASPMMNHATQIKQLKDTFTSTATTIEPTISDLETLATKDINLHQPFNNELTLPPTDDGNNYIPFMYGPASIHSNSPLPLVDRTPLSPTDRSQEIPNRSTIVDDDGGHEDQELTYEELQPHDSLSMIYEHNDLDNNNNDQKVKSPPHHQQQNKEGDSNENMAELLEKVSRILEPNEVDEIREECSRSGENQCQASNPKQYGSLEDKNGVSMIAKAVKHSDMKFIIMESATAGESRKSSLIRGNNETIVAKVKEVVGSSDAHVPIASAELKKVATTPKSNSMKGTVTEVQSNETSCNNTINDLSALLNSELTLDPITLKYLTQIRESKNTKSSPSTNNLSINDLSKTIYTSTPNTSIEYHGSPCNTEQIRSNRKSGKAEKDGLSENISNLHEGFSLASLEFLKKHGLLNK
ncbi:hypothetical protein BKA69DRAFT_1067908 [Paraphysoderma sedebokerense]|nr:hypothetical protein BKA69DRAFT_1067908 [Paraphysoderma sedebokerense]